ncbi:general amino acid permease [Serpula lacrymans var. lacrymans S7.9]|uniref:General amino acid permease n=1 Tax=Serpula lacrymans var. lacrymans (strain S7.9) TaxID=578457 RepID=F8NS63_SERL9|nr:general amino acid permease [Serpula lacrymans var. lacrymans S7.9]EGO27031.1 general amino acid permease [Serpula lacrymans var. lacrymans S7.9]
MSSSSHKTPANDIVSEPASDAAPLRQGPAFEYQRDLDKVQRKLGRQHIQMLALAGTIGTGLFLGLGQILALCGPLGALLVYLHVASVVYATLTSVGELTAYAPVSGTLIHYAARWFDPALGFAAEHAPNFIDVLFQLGWGSEQNYFYYAGIAVPVEVTALSVLVAFWDKDPNHTAIYIAVTIILLIIINLFGVRFFGNSEIVFATLKIMLIIGLIIGGLVVTLGGGPNHERHGFQYWRNPGPMVSYLEPGGRGRFVGMLVALVPAAFSMSGVELIAISAAETQNPRKNIVRAMRTVLFRILFFYITAVVIVGMLVPSNDPLLFQKASNAGQSPFVLAFTRAGIKALPSIINAVLLTSAFSAGNTLIFASSRILYGLAVQRQAPQIFTRCTSSGVPYVAVITAGTFSVLAFLNVAGNSGTVFNWFVDLATVGGLFGWGSINLTYLRYYYGLKLQGIVPEGIYRSSLQPFAAMWGLFWVIFYILVSGISVFWAFDASTFVASYINIPIFFCLYFGFKIYYKTKIRTLRDLDFVTDIPKLEDTEDDVLPTKQTLMTEIRQVV